MNEGSVVGMIKSKKTYATHSIRHQLSDACGRNVECQCGLSTAMRQFANIITSRHACLVTTEAIIERTTYNEAGAAPDVHYNTLP